MLVQLASAESMICIQGMLQRADGAVRPWICSDSRIGTFWVIVLPAGVCACIEALLPNGHQMIGVNGLDVGSHQGCPVLQAQP